jgi:hypothetical protein
MDNFEYTFINAKIDQQIYTDILNTVFQQERGYTLHDCKDVYSGYHSTMVCKHNGTIIGGISAYISDPKRTDKLPMERRGIDLQNYVDLSNIRYAEICRVGVLPEFRKFHIYSELMKRCANFCVRIGCQIAFWIAKKYYSQYEESELKLMGMDVKLLDVNTLSAKADSVLT